MTGDRDCAKRPRVTARPAGGTHARQQTTTAHQHTVPRGTLVPFRSRVDGVPRGLCGPAARRPESRDPGLCGPAGEESERGGDRKGLSTSPRRARAGDSLPLPARSRSRRARAGDSLPLPARSRSRLARAGASASGTTALRYTASGEVKDSWWLLTGWRAGSRRRVARSTACSATICPGPEGGRKLGEVWVRCVCVCGWDTRWSRRDPAKKRKGAEQELAETGPTLR